MSERDGRAINRRAFIAALAAVGTAGCASGSPDTDRVTSTPAVTDGGTDVEQEKPPGVGVQLFDSPPLKVYLADGEAWVWPSTIRTSVGYTTEKWVDSPPTRDETTDVEVHEYDPDGFLVPVGIGASASGYSGSISVDDLWFSVSGPTDGEARLLREQAPEARVAYDDVGRTFTLPEDGHLSYSPPAGVVVEVPREAWFLSYGLTAAGEDVRGVGRELSLPALRKQMDDSTDGGGDSGE
jgi:hypothetical protein